MTEYDPVAMQFDGDKNAQQVASRLRFEQWLWSENRNELTEPQEAIPKEQTRITALEQIQEQMRKGKFGERRV